MIEILVFLPLIVVVSVLAAVVLTTMSTFKSYDYEPEIKKGVKHGLDVDMVIEPVEDLGRYDSDSILGRCYYKTVDGKTVGRYACVYVENCFKGVPFRKGVNKFIQTVVHEWLHFQFPNMSHMTIRKIEDWRRIENA